MLHNIFHFKCYNMNTLSNVTILTMSTVAIWIPCQMVQYQYNVKCCIIYTILNVMILIPCQMLQYESSVKRYNINTVSTVVIWLPS